MSLACLDADTAAAYTAHALEPEESRAVEEHIDSCASCRELISMVAKAGWSGSLTSLTSSRSGSEGGGTPVLPRGTRVGPFEIDAPLDAGGMGLVYAAHDVRLDRRVALKCLRERRGDPAQLLREAKLMAQLANPNVVPVYDVIEAYGQVFIAMELVVGRSLRQWMEAGPRDWKTVVDVFLDAGAGLAAAHAAGIVHGDVKPGNILVGDDGRVRVTDFGLGTFVTERPGASTSVRGTPAYLAPEQRTGRPCDALGDQYSFCVSLHEALTGALPGARPPRMAGLPRGVRRVLTRGLREDPGQRYPSMRALLGALRAARSPRWKWALGAVATTAASVGLAYVFGVRQVEVEQCAVAASELASPWDAESKEALRGAFARTRLPYAGETLDKVVASLDGWSAGFEEARGRACAAGWFRRETPLERLPGQLSCLKDRAREARALVNLLRDADATVVQNSVTATEHLTPVERCAQTAPARTAPADSPGIAPLREQLATVNALMSSAKYREARELAQKLMKDAEALGDTRFLASAKLGLGASQVWLDDYAAATANLLEAIRLADVTQDDRTRAQAWVRLGQAEFRQGHHDKVLFLQGPALGACERLGDVWLHSEMYLFLGGSLSQLGRPKEAQALFENAVRMRIQAYGERDYRTSFALSSLGNALAMQGDLAGGTDAHRRALVAAQAALGTSHPNIGVLHGNLASDYLYGLQARRAVEELEKSRAIAEAAHGPKQLNVARALTSLGGALLEAGEPQRALETFERAETVWDDVAPKHPSRAFCLLGRNLAAQALGRRMSLEELERAAELGGALPGFMRGRIQLELARALSPGKASPRAIALMKEARAGLSTSTLPLVQRELGRANEWLHAQGVEP
ncbi:serine/threonine protein kinase [Pyxidicoccus fallax]|uniref:Serine/threonine protein kinase n=1 Tax=Pyxidicoccus fallax TaxID=394095 RepID=A0A848LUS2_9BACT|nr:protein kinase [Pyxidicoccus fallax]NMO21391.1 serine/threonine protein kinase [Pyxidicoccus fallax]NPC83862.1 serine/threonine protein kinase [Pyxidicoccus fallax]